MCTFTLGKVTSIEMRLCDLTLFSTFSLLSFLFRFCTVRKKVSLAKVKRTIPKISDSMLFFCCDCSHLKMYAISLGKVTSVQKTHISPFRGAIRECHFYQRRDKNSLQTRRLAAEKRPLGMRFAFLDEVYHSLFASFCINFFRNFKRVAACIVQTPKM